MATFLNELILYLAQVAIHHVIVADFGNRLVHWVVLLVPCPCVQNELLGAIGCLGRVCEHFRRDVPTDQSLGFFVLR